MASPTSGSAATSPGSTRASTRTSKAAYRQLLELPRGAREPAAPGRLRPRPVRDPHQLHEHSRRCPRFTLDDLADDPTEPLRLLRAVFTTRRRSGRRRRPAQITEEAAEQFARLAAAPPRRAATTRRRSRTSSTSSCSACSPRTPGSCPRASFSACRRRPHGDSGVFIAGLGELFAKMSDGRRPLRRRADRMVQRRSLRRRRRLPLDRRRDHDPARGRQARLGEDRAGHLRDALRARPRPEHSAPSSAPTTPTGTPSGASSSRSSCARSGASTRRCRRG